MRNEGKIKLFFCLRNVTYILSIALLALKIVNTFLDNHSEDCSSTTSNQKLNMELFAAIVFGCSVVSSLCSVPSASNQADIVKRNETCQEGINTVSEKLVTRNLFGQWSPKGCS